MISCQSEERSRGIIVGLASKTWTSESALAPCTLDSAGVNTFWSAKNKIRSINSLDARNSNKIL